MATSLSATQQTTAPKVNQNMQSYRKDYDYSEAPGKSAQPNTMLDCRMGLLANYMKHLIDWGTLRGSSRLMLMLFWMNSHPAEPYKNIQEESLVASFQPFQKSFLFLTILANTLLLLLEQRLHATV